MTSFSSIWTTSFNQALLLKNNGIPSISGVSPTTSAGATDASGGSLAGIEPLDLLLGQVSKSVSGVMSSFSLTKGMNFSKSFSSAFTPSPFQKSLTTLNNTLAASSISSLAKGVFSEATSAATMTRAEKENLMTAILSGVNLGFMSATSLMKTTNIMTGMIQQSLDNIQSNVRTSVDSYYTAYTNNALPGQTTVFAAPATSTPSSTTTTTPSTTPTTPAPPSVPATTSGSPASGTAASGSTASTAPPVPLDPALQSILSDPSVKTILDDLHKQVFTFGSGSGMFGDLLSSGGYTIHARFFQTDFEGKAHEIVSMSGNGGSYNFNVIDGTTVIDSKSLSSDQIDSLGGYTFKDAAGASHFIKAVYSGGKYDHAELDGTAISNSDLAKWAETAGLSSKTNYDGSKVFYINTETSLGSQKKFLVGYPYGFYALVPKTTFEFDEMSGFFKDEVFIKNANGDIHTLSTEGGNQYDSFYADGVFMEPADLVQWAKNNGFEKVSITTDQGATANIYYGDIITANGVVKAKIAEEADGDPMAWYSSVPVESTIVKDASGQNHILGEHRMDSSNWQEQTWLTIDGMAVSQNEAANMVKSGIWSDIKTIGSTGAERDYYTSGESSNMNSRTVVIDRATGNVSIGYNNKSQIKMAGTNITQTTYSSFGAPSAASFNVNGAEMNAQQLRDWAVANNAKTGTWTSDPSTGMKTYTEYLDDNGNPIIGESNGVVDLPDNYGHNAYTPSYTPPTSATPATPPPTTTTQPAPPVGTGAPAGPTGPVIQIDQAILDRIKELKATPYAFASGTNTFDNDKNDSLYYLTDASGINHSVYSDFTKGDYFIVDEKTLVKSSQTTNYVNSLAAFNFKDTAGVAHSVKGNWDGTKVSSVTLDGQTMTTDEFANWAKAANLLSNSDNGVKTYYAKIEQNGVASFDKALAYEFDYTGGTSTLFNEDNFYGSYIIDSGITLETKSGKKARFDPMNYGLNGASSPRSYGTPLVEDLLNWAASSGAEKQTVQQGGETYDIYFADMKLADGDSVKVALGARDSNGKTTAIYGASVSEITDLSGKSHSVAIYNTWNNNSSAPLLAIDGSFDEKEIVSLLKSDFTRTNSWTDANGASIDFYDFNKNPYYYAPPIAVNNADGSLHSGNVNNHSITRGGDVIDFSLLNLDNKIPRVAASLNGNKMTDNQLSDWIKNNASSSIDIKAQNGTNYTFYSGQDISFLVNSSTKEVYDSYDRKLSTSMASTPIVQHNILLPGDSNWNGSSLYSINGGAAISATELRDWAVANNAKTGTWTSPTGETYTEYLADNGRPIIGERNGVIDLPDNYGHFYSSPIVLDMEGNGIKSVAAEQGVNFDLLGNGRPVRTGWVGGGDDAFLALDRNANGKIDSGLELFGNQHGAANGYEELAKFDDNNDGSIDSRDAVFSRLQLWNDANLNGASDAGELRGVAESGVASISTRFQNSNFVDAAGNEYRQLSTFTKTNGRTGQSADLWFRYNGITSYLNNQFMPPFS